MSAVGAPAGELPSPADPHATAKAITNAPAIAASGLFVCEFCFFRSSGLLIPVSGFGTAIWQARRVPKLYTDP